ncbi:MAG TPA: hypothetical protein VGD78_01815 [Chthoniobacterales bacterium]
MTPIQTPDNVHLTVTLTGRRPVRIQKDHWPVIARARRARGEVADQTLCHLVVRQHQDGRTLVYGVSESAAEEQNRRAGYLLEAGADLCKAIWDVSGDLGFDPEMAQACIASLPAEDLE